MVFNWNLQKTILGDNDEILDIAQIPLTRSIVMGTNSSEARIINLNNFQSNLLYGHSDNIMSVAAHISGVIATASKDKTIRFWKYIDAIKDYKLFILFYFFSFFFVGIHFFLQFLFLCVFFF